MIKRKTIKSAMWGRSIITACALILCASMAFAGSRKLSPDLENKAASEKVDIIVQFNQRPTAAHHKRVLRHGGVFKRELLLLQGGSYKQVPVSALKELAADPSVIHVSLDRKVKGASITANPAVLDYHNETVNAPAAWAQGLDGTGIGVAVIDSGVGSVDDLGSRVVYNQDFVAPGGTGNDLMGMEPMCPALLLEAAPIPQALATATRSRALRRTPTSSTCECLGRMAQVRTAT